MLIVHRIAPQKRPVRPQLSNDSHRDAWLYFESPDAEAAYAALREKGLDAQAPSLTYYGMNQVLWFIRMVTDFPFKARAKG